MTRQDRIVDSATFSPLYPQHKTKMDSSHTLKQTHLPSPPTSPEEVVLPGFRALTSYEGFQDPPLYSDPSKSGQNETPLFQTSQTSSHAINHNIDNISPNTSPVLDRATTNDTSGESPNQNVPSTQPESDRRRSDSLRLTSPAEILNIRSLEDFKAYRKACIDEASQCRRIGQWLALQRKQERDPYTEAQLRSLDRASGFSTTKRSGASAKMAAASPVSTSSQVDSVLGNDATTQESAVRRSRPVRSSRPSRPSRGNDIQSFMDMAFPNESTTPSAEKRQRKRAASTPGPDSEKKHKRAPPTKVVSRKGDDSKWRELPDYSPPVSILDNKKANPSWGKGGRLDVSQKDDVDELHPQEKEICEVLRIEPQQYLANKRRIFAARLEQLHNPGKKGWNKTACQQACGVDVNKSSQLFIIFDNLGWFEKEYFEKWL